MMVVGDGYQLRVVVGRSMVVGVALCVVDCWMLGVVC